MSISRFALRCLFLVLGTGMTVGQAGAQVCAVPLSLAPNTPTWINTCQGEQGIVIACALFPLRGPAGVVRMSLPYPVGTVTAQSINGDYDPSVFMLRSQCSNNAGCGMMVDSGPVVDTLNLSELDSGEYFMVIAPYYFTSSACGQVIVTYNLTPAQQALMLDGVFRGGISAPTPFP